MKKHTSRFFAVVMIAVISIASVLPAFAAKSEAEIQPLWTNMNSMDITISKSGGYYDVKVEGKEGTTKIEVTATLYEQGIAGYVKKDSVTGSKNSDILTVRDTYSFNSSKLYKVVATAKVTANGVTETVTLEKVK